MKENTGESVVRTTLEESLSITTGRCDLAIVTHARKMHKKYQYDCQLEYFS
jgi:hypothetical protein